MSWVSVSHRETKGFCDHYTAIGFSESLHVVMIHCRLLWVSVGYFESLQALVSRFRILWVSACCYESLQAIVLYYMLRVIAGCCDSSKDVSLQVVIKTLHAVVSHHKLLWVTTEIWAIKVSFWDTTSCCKTPQAIVSHYRVLLDTTSCCETLQAVVSLYGLLWVTTGCC